MRRQELLKEEEAAALRIQSLYRGGKDRQAVKQMAEQEAHAVSWPKPVGFKQKKEVHGMEKKTPDMDVKYVFLCFPWYDDRYNNWSILEKVFWTNIINQIIVFLFILVKLLIGQEVWWNTWPFHGLVFDECLTMDILMQLSELDSQTQGLFFFLESPKPNSCLFFLELQLSQPCSD